MKAKRNVVGRKIIDNSFDRNLELDANENEDTVFVAVSPTAESSERDLECGSVGHNGSADEKEYADAFAAIPTAGPLGADFDNDSTGSSAAVHGRDNRWFFYPCYRLTERILTWMAVQTVTAIKRTS